jgi:predicted AlkP superfamily pyrophosphatase or phosphodiesterase
MTYRKVFLCRHLFLNVRSGEFAVSFFGNMVKKAILVLLDGLRFDVAQSHMGFLGHLVESGQASLYRVRSELPSLSRPMYETLLTGTPTSLHGITANSAIRLSHQTSLFHLATQQGLITAAAAYSWFSELYNRSPFDPVRDRILHDPSLPIQHGIYYWEDSYPDSHLLADAEILRQQYQPDFMLVHPMGLDDTGHRFGGESPEYRAQAIATDSLLSLYLPRWWDAGYEILITADHGMNADGLHGGTLPDVREVPLFCIGQGFTPGVYLEGLSQLAIAPLMCQMLGISTAPAMRSIPVPGYLTQASLLSPEPDRVHAT